MIYIDNIQCDVKQNDQVWRMLDAWNVYYSAPIDWMSTYQIVKLYEELVRVKCIQEIQEENHVTSYNTSYLNVYIYFSSYSTCIIFFLKCSRINSRTWWDILREKLGANGKNVVRSLYTNRVFWGPSKNQGLNSPKRPMGVFWNHISVRTIYPRAT